MLSNRLILLILCSCLAFSCQKNEEEVEPIQNAEEPTPVYFKAIINGNPYSIEMHHLMNTETDNAMHLSSGSTGNSGFPYTRFHHSSSLIESKNNQFQRFGIHFLRSLDNTDLKFQEGLHRYKDKIQFEQVLTVGPRNFQYDYLYGKDNAVSIEFRDLNGIVWSTSRNHGSGMAIEIPKIPNYAGHTFNVTASTPHQPISEAGHQVQLVKINFNCYLYNATGDSLRVENAEYQGIFQNFWLAK